MKLTTAQQMKDLDRIAIEEHGIPSIWLMEDAAGWIASAALDLLPDFKEAKSMAGQADVPVHYRGAALCGVGNNGGDGIGAAHRLALSGIRTRIFLVGNPDKLTVDTKKEIQLLGECGLKAEPFDPSDNEQRDWILNSNLIIDALFGVGLSRPIAPDSVYAAAIQLMNESRGKIVSADLPSGVNADTGQVMGCAVHADRTVTFTLGKIGHFVGAGSTLTGKLEIQDIGIPPELPDALVCPVQTLDTVSLPPRDPNGHKGTFGKLLIIGGAIGYTGAPYLTAAAAIRSGCGLVSLGVPQSIWTIEAMKCTSAMPFPLPDTGAGCLTNEAFVDIWAHMESSDVLALGPGLSRHPDSRYLARTLLKEVPQPVVLDADGINALAGHMDILDERRERITILTPHDGEFAYLLGMSTVEELANADRLALARDFAQQYNCILVLKGHRTLIAAPDGTVRVNITGNSGMAKGGSGDVLTGIIASLLCQGLSPFEAAASGVRLHGRAGDIAALKLTEYSMAPEDLLSALPEAFREAQS